VNAEDLAVGQRDRTGQVYGGVRQELALQHDIHEVDAERAGHDALAKTEVRRKQRTDLRTYSLAVVQRYLEVQQGSDQGSRAVRDCADIRAGRSRSLDVVAGVTVSPVMPALATT
jgi:hypothetical protein